MPIYAKVQKKKKTEPTPDAGTATSFNPFLNDDDDEDGNSDDDDDDPDYETISVGSVEIPSVFRLSANVPEYVTAALQATLPEPDESEEHSQPRTSEANLDFADSAAIPEDGDVLTPMQETAEWLEEHGLASAARHLVYSGYDTLLFYPWITKEELDVVGLTEGTVEATLQHVRSLPAAPPTLQSHLHLLNSATAQTPITAVFNALFLQDYLSVVEPLGVETLGDGALLDEKQWRDAIPLPGHLARLLHVLHRLEAQATVDIPFEYEPIYLGTVALPSMDDPSALTKAMTKLKNSSAAKKPKAPIKLRITHASVRFLAPANNSTILEHAVDTLLAVAHDAEDASIHAYVNQSEGKYMCHVFRGATVEVCKQAESAIRLVALKAQPQPTPRLSPARSPPPPNTQEPSPSASATPVQLPAYGDSGTQEISPRTSTDLPPFGELSLPASAASFATSSAASSAMASTDFVLPSYDEGVSATYQGTEEELRLAAKLDEERMAEIEAARYREQQQSQKSTTTSASAPRSQAHADFDLPAYDDTPYGSTASASVSASVSASASAPTGAMPPAFELPSYEETGSEDVEGTDEERRLAAKLEEERQAEIAAARYHEEKSRKSARTAPADRPAFAEHTAFELPAYGDGSASASASASAAPAFELPSYDESGFDDTKSTDEERRLAAKLEEERQAEIAAVRYRESRASVPAVPSQVVAQVESPSVTAGESGTPQRPNERRQSASGTPESRFLFVFTNYPPSLIGCCSVAVDEPRIRKLQAKLASIKQSKK
eukprot:m.552760 g.552760  ORF g.552760 m.552760 type:complete len:779 (-) comp57740_c2_seq39:79-2415(-)